MSAAEKMKALWTTASRTEAEEAMHRSWPQIVAVVEAMEAVAGPAAYRGGLTGRVAQARNALSALDEALSQPQAEKLGDVT